MSMLVLQQMRNIAPAEMTSQKWLITGIFGVFCRHLQATLFAE
jgi:hypothetical protein